ncbi:shugoshin 2 isoform X1 [Erythrolamprus reginae]|uniref:shugoshin 2 isoform X1 n=1 Tax=Erythrolamprus reginae TaxID=121349 RepID=UPI00396CE5D4
MEIDVMAEASSLFTIGGIKKHVMEKKKGDLKVKKLNASLASKIKTKIIRNSSFLKNSLKHNNKALVMALSTEKENSRRLNNENSLLQKELDGLNLQNILLRRKLSYLNKTLKEIQAFLKYKILTAIELSTFSECIPKPVTMDDTQCSNSGHESNISKNRTRPIEQYFMPPHIVESDVVEKGNLFVCDTDGPFKQISVLSKKITADHMNMQILYPKQMPKPSEINKMETEFATNTFPEEKQFHMKQISNSTSLDYASSADEYESQSKRHNSLFPIHGYIRERKKEMCISNIQPILNNFGTKRDRNCILQLCTGRVSKNDINNQRGPNGVSHIELPSQISSKLVYMNKDDLTRSQKPEETIYDADMEETVSELGEIVTIKSRDKKLNKVKADKISGNLRKVTFASTKKHI